MHAGCKGSTRPCTASQDSFGCRPTALMHLWCTNKLSGSREGAASLPDQLCTCSTCSPLPRVTVRCPGTTGGMEEGSGGGGSLPGLPRLQVVPPPPPPFTNAWSAAFEEASLLSPAASARSFTSKLTPGGVVGLLRSEAAAEVASGWAAVAREASR